MFTLDLNDRCPNLFIYFNLGNPYPFKSFKILKPEKGIPFGRSLPMYIGHYRKYPSGFNTGQLELYKCIQRNRDMVLL